MLITLKHYEKSSKNTTERIATVFIMLVLGVGFWWLGIPFILVVIGYIWSVFLKSRLSIEDQDESNLLRNLVTDTLGKALKANKLKAKDISFS